jgi:hypothetical protein
VPIGDGSGTGPDGVLAGCVLTTVRVDVAGWLTDAEMVRTASSAFAVCVGRWGARWTRWVFAGACTLAILKGSGVRRAWITPCDAARCVEAPCQAWIDAPPAANSAAAKATAPAAQPILGRQRRRGSLFGVVMGSGVGAAARAGREKPSSFVQKLIPPYRLAAT